MNVTKTEHYNQGLASYLKYEKLNVQAAKILPTSVINSITDHMTSTTTHKAAYLGGIAVLILILTIIVIIKVKNCIKECSVNSEYTKNLIRNNESFSMIHAIF